MGGSGGGLFLPDNISPRLLEETLVVATDTPPSLVETSSFFFSMKRHFFFAAAEALERRKYFVGPLVCRGPLLAGRTKINEPLHAEREVFRLSN